MSVNTVFASQRPSGTAETRRCEWCGAPFPAHQPNRKYCRDRCRKDAYDERKYRKRVERMLERATETFRNTMRAVIEEEFRR